MNQRLEDITEVGDMEDVDNLLYEEISHVSEKAVLFVMQDGKEKWIPKSQLRVDFEGTLYVSNWFASKENL